MEAHLFETKINQQGRDLLVRMKKWARLFYACAIITCVFDLINAILVLRNFLRLSYSYPALLKFEGIVSMIFLVIFSSLLVLSGYFFYVFATRSTAAVDMEDEAAYNNSLRFLLKHIIVSSILFALNSLWVLMLVYIQIKMGY